MSAPEESSLLTIDVSADDYAKVAATDQAVPSAADRDARTHQTEEAFQAAKATYSAKLDNGNIWQSLRDFDPPFQYHPTIDHDHANPQPSSPSAPLKDPSNPRSGPDVIASPPKKKMGKREWLVVIAAVGELYWAEDYELILSVCDWAEGQYELDAKMGASVRRWREKSGACHARVGEGEGVEG